MGRAYLIGLFFLTVLIGFFGYRYFFRQVSAPAPRLSQPAPDLILQDYDGREIKLSDFRGKLVLVNSWASWCPFCQDELLDFAAVQKEFGEKISVIAVNRQEPLEVAKQYSDELEEAAGSIIFLLDPSDSFYQSIGGFSMPETVFVDKDGFVRDHKRGPMELEEIRRKIQQAFELMTNG